MRSNLGCSVFVKINFNSSKREKRIQIGGDLTEGPSKKDINSKFEKIANFERIFGGKNDFRKIEFHTNKPIKNIRLVVTALELPR